MNKIIYLFILLLLVNSNCKDKEVVPKENIDYVTNLHLTLGNPSNATTDISYENNFLLKKKQYVMSYNKDRGIPNWVSWHLSEEWLGDKDRQDDFKADNTLPVSWYIVEATSYAGSGFDRGHNTPSGDRTREVIDNSATFLMTNIIPQAPKHNRETWVNLEDYARFVVKKGFESYIIMGNYGIGGVGSYSRIRPLTTIPQSH